MKKGFESVGAILYYDFVLILCLFFLSYLMGHFLTPFLFIITCPLFISRHSYILQRSGKKDELKTRMGM